MLLLALYHCIIVSDEEVWCVQVAKESDMGVNDTTYQVLTHLGHILKPGDLALGYDLKHTVINGPEFESVADVFLVKKAYDKPVKASGKKFRKKKDAIYADIIAHGDMDPIEEADEREGSDSGGVGASDRGVVGVGLGVGIAEPESTIEAEGFEA
jgi:hypothetical protein